MQLANNMMDIIDENLNVESEEAWRIENDNSAEWALSKLRENNAEFNRYKMVVDDKKRVLEEEIDRLTEQLEIEKKKLSDENSFFESKLREYFETVKKKETKTQLSYKLPSGSMKMKKAKVDFDYNKDKLLDYAKENKLDDFIKTSESFIWAEFKKNLVIEGNTIINKETGEVIDCEGLGVKEKPEEFKVEV